MDMDIDSNTVKPKLTKIFAKLQAELADGLP